jgi:nitroreductase
MRGREKGEVERIVLVAHQTEVMARQKVLKSPEHYLNRRTRPRAGARAVVASMMQAEKRGFNIRVRKITQAKESA